MKETNSLYTREPIGPEKILYQIGINPNEYRSSKPITDEQRLCRDEFNQDTFSIYTVTPVEVSRDSSHKHEIPRDALSVPERRAGANVAQSVTRQEHVDTEQTKTLCLKWDGWDRSSNMIRTKQNHNVNNPYLGTG